MYHVKTPILCFTDKRKFGDNERGRQVRTDVSREDSLHGGTVLFGQAACQRDVEPELIHHKGVAPATQIGLLPLGETVGAAPFKFVGSRGCTKRIQRFDAGRCQFVEGVNVAGGAQGEEAAHRCDLQALQRNRFELRAQVGAGRGQSGLIAAGCEPERWFDRRVQAVSACSRCDRVHRQSGHIRMINCLAGCHVPTQPGGAALRPFGVGSWRKVKGVSGEVQERLRRGVCRVRDTKSATQP